MPESRGGKEEEKMGAQSPQSFFFFHALLLRSNYRGQNEGRVSMQQIFSGQRKPLLLAHTARLITRENNPIKSQIYTRAVKEIIFWERK